MQFLKKINPDVIAIAGNWDPPLPRHIKLLKKLLSYSRKNALNPCVIILHPNPANVAYENKRKEYFDLDARLMLLKHLGINHVWVVQLTQADLQRSSGDFLDELHKSTGIALTELWVGESQRLGTGAQGLDSIVVDCAARNIKVRILKNSFRVNLDKDAVNQDFKEGKFELTKAATGYYPTFKLNPDHLINLHDGHYHAKLRTAPFTEAGELPVTVKIADGRLESIKRPDEYDWLVLTARVSEP